MAYLPALCHWSGRIDSQPIDGGDPEQVRAGVAALRDDLRRSVVECGVCGMGELLATSARVLAAKFAVLLRGRRPVSISARAVTVPTVGLVKRRTKTNQDSLYSSCHGDELLNNI